MKNRKQILPAAILSLLAANMTYASNNPFSEKECSLGQKLIKGGHYREAIPHFTHAIELDPHSRAIAYYYQQRGYALWQLEERKEALVDFKKAVEIDPPLAGAHWNLSQCEFEMGKTSEAIAAIAKAIQFEKDPCINAKMLTTRSAYYSTLKRNKEAIADLNKSIALCPHDYWNLRARAEVYYKTQDYKKAVDDYTTLLNSKESHTENHGELNEMRARCYEKLGRKDLADAERKHAATQLESDPYNDLMKTAH